MRNKILLYGMMLVGAVSISSCNDTLDKEPLDGFQNSPEFWNNEQTVEGYSNKYYESFTGYGNGGGQGLFYFKTLSDDQAGNAFSDWKFVNIPSKSSDWRGTYDEIRRANVMIQGMENSTLKADVKNHWMGVARLNRAFQYFDLVRKFGNCLWLDRPLDPKDSKFLYGERNDRDMVMDKVLEDLNFAVDNIKASSSKTTWSRNMALAMKADICLWEGTFRKYRSTTDGQKAPDMDGAKKFLNECVNACTPLMQDYTLSDSYRAIYNSESLLNNKEIIFCKQYKEDIFQHSTIDYTCSSTQISGMTKDAFDAYLFKDGKPLALTAQDKSDAAVVDAQGKLSIAKLLAERDARLGETIDPVVMYPGNTWKRTDDGMEMTSSTGYGVCKYDNVAIPLKHRNQTGSNYTDAPIYWLSVVYLNYAEAKAELGTLTDQDLNNSINKLRARAGLPNMTVAVGFDDPANNMNVSSLIWEVRRERRCELMFDNDFRYWDLIRWHQLDKLDSTKYPNILLGANVSKASGVTVPVKGDYLDGSKGKTRTYEPKHYLYPIPSGQLQLNSALGQNFGWE